MWRVYSSSGTAQVELKSGQVQAPGLGWLQAAALPTAYLTVGCRTLKPVQTRVETAWFQSFKVNHCKLLSFFRFNLNLRHYLTGYQSLTTHGGLKAGAYTRSLFSST